MAKSKMTLEAKKGFAKLLYTREHFNGKLVAERVGVAEKTISKWVNDGNWKALRRRLLSSKEEQINSLYEQLENLNDTIKNREEGKQFADSKEADVISKLTASIKNLEQDLNIADLVESGTRFVKYIQAIESFSVVSATADLWNNFLNAQLKSK